MKPVKKSSFWSRQAAQLPLGRALFWIFLSVIVITGPVALVLLYTTQMQRHRLHDSRYAIVALVQTGPEREQLSSGYLAQLLELSVDNPTNLYALNASDAERRLLADPLISMARVKKIAPGTLYIDYTIRKPIAYLGDYSNTAIASDGVLIPFAPFFTPKRLPEIRLGAIEAGPLWGSKLAAPSYPLACALLEAFKERGIAVQKIDLAQAQEESCGRRQLVVQLYEEGPSGEKIELFLRLSCENFGKEIARYARLKGSSHASAIFKKEAPIVLDMRINDLVFVRGGAPRAR